MILIVDFNLEKSEKLTNKPKFIILFMFLMLTGELNRHNWRYWKYVNPDLVMFGLELLVTILLDLLCWRQSQWRHIQANDNFLNRKWNNVSKGWCATIFRCSGETDVERSFSIAVDRQNGAGHPVRSPDFILVDFVL